MNASVKAWLLLAGIFVVGVVTGCALTFGFASHFKAARNEADMRTHLMGIYVRRLDLTDDQRAKIQPIVRDTVHNIQELHRDEVTRGSEIFRATDQKILAILTSDQKAQLEKLEQDQEAMFANHLMRPNGQPHQGGGPNSMPGFFRQMDQQRDRPNSPQNYPPFPPPPSPPNGDTNALSAPSPPPPAPTQTTGTH